MEMKKRETDRQRDVQGNERNKKGKK